MQTKHMPISAAAVQACVKEYPEHLRRSELLNRLACAVQGDQGRAVCWRVKKEAQVLAWRDEIKEAIEGRTHIV